ncbi:MAG: replicative DNA helicase [Chloroflexota bacterium]|nr:replicative DNA helicase [Chloroflexota bacterium]
MSSNLALASKRERVSGRTLAAPVPPNATELLADHTAETALIGVVLADPLLYAQVCDLVQPADFQNLFHGFVWKAIEDVAARGEEIELNTVVSQLETYKQVGRGDTDRMIHDLSSYMTTGMGGAVLNYARRIRSVAMAIRVLSASMDLQRAILETPRLRIDSDALVELTNNTMFKATEQTPEHDTSIFGALGTIASNIEARMNDEALPTVATGFTHIDESDLGGLVRGEITMLAGGPGMGKTTMALSAVDMIARRGVRGAVFSLEMTREEIVTALMSMNTGIPRSVIGRKKLTTAQYSSFLQAAKTVSAYPIEIADKRQYPSLSPRQLRIALRRMMASGKVEYAVIDGLWLMDSDEQVDRRGNPLPKPERPREVHLILRELSDIATEFNLPILLIHQYKREWRYRNDKRPQMDDLAEGSSCERTCQIIMALHRASYHDHGEGDDKTEMYLLKDRNGKQVHAPYVFKWVPGKDKYVNVG